MTQSDCLWQGKTKHITNDKWCVNISFDLAEFSIQLSLLNAGPRTFRPYSRFWPMPVEQYAEGTRESPTFARGKNLCACYNHQSLVLHKICSITVIFNDIQWCTLIYREYHTNFSPWCRSDVQGWDMSCRWTDLVTSCSRLLYWNILGCEANVLNMRLGWCPVQDFQYSVVSLSASFYKTSDSVFLT